jgi:hypothetical protein
MEVTGVLERQDLSDNAHVFWGSHLEAAIAGAVLAKHNLKLHSDYNLTNEQFFIKDFDHRLIANFDYLIETEDGLAPLEIKSVSEYSEWPQQEELPLHYDLQVHQQGYLLQKYFEGTGTKIAPYAFVGVKHGNSKMPILIRREYNAACFDLIVTEAKVFWSDVQNNVVPPLLDMDLRTYAKIHAVVGAEPVKQIEPEGALLELSQEYLAVLENRQALDEKVKDIKKVEDDLKAKLLTMTGSGTVLTVQGTQIIIKIINRKGYVTDVKPTQYVQFTTKKV